MYESTIEKVYLRKVAMMVEARMMYSNANSSCTEWPPVASVVLMVDCRNMLSTICRRATCSQLQCL
jgi:hypothetical protein